MSEGTKRTIRTAYASAVAFLLAVPVMVGLLPIDLIDGPVEAKIAAFAAWVVFVNKAINTLEDRGVIPAWLRDANENKEN